MVATLPAALLVDEASWRTGVSGTLWNGQVGIQGGTSVEWHWAPLRSLTSLGFAVDWHATGPDTDLAGRALVRSGRTVIDKATGSATTALLEAAWPDLPFTCTLPMQVSIDRLALGGGDQAMEGKALTSSGSCAAAATPGAPVPVAPLSITADRVGGLSTLRVTPADQRRRTLIEAKLPESGPLSVTMTPDGAAALPFMGIPGGATVETEL